MKQIERFLYHACTYTVLITVIFYIFSMLSGLENAEMTFSRFILILVYGFLISGAEVLLTLKKVPLIVRYMSHYLILFGGFFIIFLSVKGEGGNNRFSAATVFASLVIFSLLYAVIMTAAHFTKKLFEKIKSKKTPAVTKQTKPYKNRFSE